MHFLALGLLLLGQTNTLSPEEIWPQWRGPTGDSISPGRGLPTHWSQTENIVWKTPLPGWGNSTPAIWKDDIFVTTEDGERLLLLHIDRVGGKILWEREVGRGLPRYKGPVGNGYFHIEQNLATPSPVTDGQYVWAHFGNGDLACYDFGGNKKWGLNMAQTFGAYTIWNGHANSPVLLGDLLISACMQDPKGDGQSYVVALDKMSGEQKWLTKRITGALKEPADSYTTPLLFKHEGRTEVLVYGGNVLDAYEPTDGRRLWQCEAFKGNRAISGPTLAGDTVFAVQGMKGPVFAVKAGGTDIESASRVRWKYPCTTSPDAASPLVTGGLVFMVNNDGIAYCLDAGTGKEVWKERLRGEFRATPLAADENVYFLSKSGKATIIKAARTFEILAECDLGEETIASPAVSSGNLFIRTKNNIYRIGENKK
jgi:outer membrane protein assembly factor BamB